MSILKKLSIRNLKLNKKRSIGTIMGIVLSVALVTAVAGMFTSFHRTLVQNTIESTGYYHYSISEIDEDMFRDLKSNRDIENIMTSYFLGTALYSQTEEDGITYLNVSSTEYFDELQNKIVKGRKPQNANELVIPESLAIEQNIKVEDTLELEVGTRLTEDGYELDMTNPSHEEAHEYIANATHKTYKVVGTFEGNGSRYSMYSPNSTTMVYYKVYTINETSSKIDVFMALKNPKEHDSFVAGLIATGKFDPTNGPDYYQLNANLELLRWECFAFSDSTISMLYAVVGTVLAIIVITSVFCIRNSFAISTTEKSKMLGMLASVGATKKQIKRSVLIEAFILGAIGIPLGILSGIFADFVLIKVVNLILKDYIFQNAEGLIFTISFLPCLVAAILGIVTIYLSAIFSARRASRISPIDNMRSSKDVMLNKKNLKIPRIIPTIFKTGGVLAYKNLKRSKKKYRTTVISIAISVFIFIALNTFLTDTFGMTNRYYTTYDYNVALNSIRELQKSDITALAKLDNIEEFHTTYEIYTNQNDYIKIYDRAHTADLGEAYDNCDKYDADTTECTGPHIGTSLIGLDDASFKNYVESLGLNYQQTKNKGILADTVVVYLNDKETETRRFTYQKGDHFKGTFHNSDFDVEIGAITTNKPYGIENYNYPGGYFIVDVDYFQDIEFTPMLITIKSKNPDKLVKDINAYKKGLGVYNIEEEQKYNRAISLVISIFLYGFIAVITLIGVTNIFNTITSNMELRGKEFAMLKSIGMTKKEFSRMINLETFFYSTKSLVYGIIFGLLGSFLVHASFNTKQEVAYNFPLTAILISIVFVFILVSIIMHFSITKINKQNTIETIRNENI